jgi:universal stress protein E
MEAAMKLLEKILLATDLSEAAGSAVGMAAWAAKSFGSQVILMNVIPDFPGSPHAGKIVRTAVEERLEKIRGALAAQGIHVAETVIETGAAETRIADLAEIRDVNVLMIGSGSREGKDRFLLGTTAGKLLRGSRKPVWVVRTGATPPVSSVLCPVDFSEHSRRAMENALSIAGAVGARLTVLTVLESPAGRLHFPVKAIFRLKGRQAWEKCQREEFEKFLARFEAGGVRLGKMVRKGRAADEILAAAGETRPDLIVMGCQGRTGIERLILGSAAEKVIRDLPCSVLALRAEHAIRLRMEAAIDDLEAGLKEGRELLAKGFAEEALRQFKRILERDAMLATAWEGMAAAHDRLGRAAAARECAERAKVIRRKLWEQDVEAEIKSRSGMPAKPRKRRM